MKTIETNRIWQKTADFNCQKTKTSEVSDNFVINCNHCSVQTVWSSKNGSNTATACKLFNQRLNDVLLFPMWLIIANVAKLLISKNIRWPKSKCDQSHKPQKHTSSVSHSYGEVKMCNGFYSFRRRRFLCFVVEGDFVFLTFFLTNRQQVTFGIKTIYNPPGEERLPQSRKKNTKFVKSYFVSLCCLRRETTWAPVCDGTCSFHCPTQ